MFFSKETLRKNQSAKSLFINIHSVGTLVIPLPSRFVAYYVRRLAICLYNFFLIYCGSYSAYPCFG